MKNYEKLYEEQEKQISNNKYYDEINNIIKFNRFYKQWGANVLSAERKVKPSTH